MAVLECLDGSRDAQSLLLARSIREAQSTDHSQLESLVRNVSTTCGRMCAWRRSGARGAVAAVYRTR